MTMKDNLKVIHAIKEFDEKDKIKNIILIGENGSIRNIEFDNYAYEEELWKIQLN